MKRNKILFTHSYFLQFDPKQLAWNKPYPPLMTIQAAALLREAGFSVDLFDVMFIKDPNQIRTVLDQGQFDIMVIFDDGFNYLTKMCLTNMREAAWTMAKIAKEKNCTTIACSSDATDHFQSYLQNSIDYVLIGEGEQTLLELVESIENHSSIEQIFGISYLKEDQVIRNSNRPVMRDLDALPLPAWDLINFTEYQKRWRPNWGYFSINIATTRGCPYKCNWCAKPIYGNSYKMRSPDHVIEEIVLLKQKTSFEHIWFCDDIFGLKRSWVIEFAQLVKEKGLKFRYKIQSRADLLVKDQYIEALADSGCEEAWMGVESGSQEILDAMDKGITLAQVHEANHKLKANGIKPCFFIQFGYLKETAEDIKKTIDMICQLLPHDIGISVSYPLPGTKFFEIVQEDLENKTNWEHSNDLDLMFRNTYSTEFYKKLHPYVHQKFRSQQAKDQIKNLLKNPGQLRYQTLKRALSYFYYAPAAIKAKQKLKAINYEAAIRI